MEQIKARPEQEQTISKDLLPIKEEDRKWGFGNYFALWMGSVHNVPAYITVGGFFALGLSVGQVFWAIMLAAIILGVLFSLAGHSGAKYGIPSTMLLKTSFGTRGSIVPGVIRGVIAAIMWFGFQTYTGSLAVTILIGKLWPTYLTLGGDWNFFGLNLPGLISFLLFWAVNVLFVYGGMGIIGKFTKILSPIIYLVFGGMAIWAINLAGGIGPILDYVPKGIEGNELLVFLGCISALLATFAAPAVSLSDFTREAVSQKVQSIGQASGMVLSYLLFAFASIAIIVGSEIAFGTPIWNVLDVVEKFDSTFAIAVSVLTICLTTLSVNITGNIVPAGYQLASLFPKKLTFKSGAFIAAVVGIIIMPWKLMESSTSIFLFLGIIGGLLSPILGIMLSHYFVVAKKRIDLDGLYGSSGTYHYQNGFNMPAIITLIVAGVISLIGQFVPVFKPLYDMSFFTGTIIAFALYSLIAKKPASIPVEDKNPNITASREEL
ncbi:allantoin permease [Lysinibacillus yapensis]|uniref:Allantoin permease n=1 Tax=Ureibacillus yapensis TaxID=2304605 RepID=A0A396S3F1_9BACL|nr:NCS1 family nucleobase:cation symporter [Lysinibacillus yapensis]RHW32044.1 allantoin permease [Lysinibacillus yapensis]